MGQWGDANGLAVPVDVPITLVTLVTVSQCVSYASINRAVPLWPYRVLIDGRVTAAAYPGKQRAMIVSRRRRSPMQVGVLCVVGRPSTCIDGSISVVDVTVTYI